MNFLRLAIRFPLAILWTAVMWTVRLLVMPVAWYSEPLDRRLRRAIVGFWGRGYAPIIGMKIVVHGPPPKPPFYLVANHLSYVDIWLLSAVTGCAFVARGDVQHWPVIGLISRSIYVLFIDRESRRDAVRVNQLIEHTLKQGDGIAVFAESRISRGLDVEPFKSALIEPAIVNHMPIHYATICYRTHPGSAPASRVIGWWQAEPFFYHMRRMLRNPGFTATIHFGEAPLEGTDRKLLAAALHAAVRQHFVPMD